MIIISQDKQSIVNFDNVNWIRVYDTSQNDNEFQVEAICDCGPVTLGNYLTEKRAMDILDAIVKAISFAMHAYVMPQK